MQVGDKVIRIPQTIGAPQRMPGKLQKKPMEGTVVYVHPQGRYHTVEFEVNGISVRENFKPGDEFNDDEDQEEGGG